MPSVEFTAEVFDDLKRISRHLAAFDIRDGARRISEVIRALDVLSHSPRIGRVVDDAKRELIIGRGAHGFVALYEYMPLIDTVYIIAIRHQREESFRKDF